jgi:hypothetical protein
MTWNKGQSGNLQGRPKKENMLDRPTNRQLKDKELVTLLRKIKPIISDAIITAAAVMKNEEASHQNQLKAATILLDNYRRLVLDLYDGEDDAEAGVEIQQNNAPVFSLRVVNEE